jgi:putative hydrolase of the HAD superfamily
MREAKGITRTCICFDLGGTLLDSGPGFCTRVVSAIGLPIATVRPLLDWYFLCTKAPQDIAIHNFCRALDIADVDAFKAAVALPQTREVRLFHDVLPTLACLSSFYLAALSNVTPWEACDIHLSHLSPYIQRVLYSFEIGATKPRVQAFRAFEHHLGFEPEQLVMVGDSFQADIMGAKEAGWKAIYLQRERKAREQVSSEADAVIFSLAELPSTLVRLFPSPY